MVYVLGLNRSCTLLCNVQYSLTKWVFVIYICLLQKGCPAIVLNNILWITLCWITYCGLPCVQCVHTEDNHPLLFCACIIKIHWNARIAYHPITIITEKMYPYSHYYNYLVGQINLFIEPLNYYHSTSISSYDSTTSLPAVCQIY